MFHFGPSLHRQHYHEVPPLEYRPDDIIQPRSQPFKGVSIMSGFTDANGKVDVQKTMKTVDIAIKTYQQVSPVMKEFSSHFLTKS